MSDPKRKISAWVPSALYDEVEKAGYTSPTIAVTKALELLIKAESGDNPETTGNKVETFGDNLETARRQLETENKSLKNEIENIQEVHNHDITGYRENIKALNVEIARLKEALSNAPDPIELAEMRGNYTGLQLVLEEKEKRIEELNKHIEDISPFANYYKNKELKQIEAPAAEKVKPWYKFW